MNEAKSVLCVDDHDDSCELLRYLLELEGYKVTTCSTSEEAVQLLSGAKYSAIILDNYLKNLSGIELCREIRASDPHTPVIFYSGAAFPRDRDAGLAAGAQAYLVKPHDFDIITETVNKLVNNFAQTIHRAA